MLTAQGDNDEIEKIFTNGGKLMTKELMSAAQRSAASAILDAPEGAWGRSATHMAAANGCVLGNTRLLPEESASTLQVLLRFGADVGLKDKAGLTPLHMATVYNCSKAVAVLLAAGADVNAATAERKLTALHMAANKDLLDVAAVLLAAKADPALQDARARARRPNERALPQPHHRGTSPHAAHPRRRTRPPSPFPTNCVDCLDCLDCRGNSGKFDFVLRRGSSEPKSGKTSFSIKTLPGPSGPAL